ncbi:MAG TPA: Holliday junction resolvase RuvX [Actinomycetota bacterium]|nr:Holliday junction resolvase RuvX [Actinomycetota bacterium]
MPRVLCVDYGGTRVGLAVSDALGRTAQPLDVLKRKKGSSLVESVLGVARRLEADEIVVGLPLKMDGSTGVAAEAARSFARSLEERWGSPVAMWDERLSTVEASRGMREAGVSARQQRETVDKVAAAMILRSYLDARVNGAAPDVDDVVLPELVVEAPRRARERKGGAGRPSLRRRERPDWREQRDQLDG